MLLPPDLVVAGRRNRPYAYLLFVKPFAHFVHQTDTDLLFSIAENLIEQLR